MKKIMIVNLAAKYGGALTILEEFYNMAKLDKSNEYIFVISTPSLENQMNITVLNFPWVKNSWLHRLFFDNFTIKHIIHEHNPDEVLSLQNLLIKHFRGHQSIYIHQPLPFSKVSFSIIKEPKLWFYRYIYKVLLTRSINNAEKIIVQTEWMKNAVRQLLRNNRATIDVRRPVLNLSFDKYENNNVVKNDLVRFFYPSSPVIYKNHRLIFEALREIDVHLLKSCQFIFTLEGNENVWIKKINNLAKKKNLDVVFIGKLNKEEMLSYYKSSILIFPSFIETFGLPLLEAKALNVPIIASDLPFSREVLGDYAKVDYIDPFDKCSLIKAMDKFINSERKVI